MSLSNRIAGLLMDMLESSGTTEIQRNELAQTLGCVPSQINYVIASRFTPEQGYIVESRRGGGGYIKITRVRLDAPVAIMHTVNCVGDAADMQTCRAHILNLHHGGVLGPPYACGSRRQCPQSRARTAPRRGQSLDIQADAFNCKRKG